MKLTAIALAWTFVLPSMFAFAEPIRHKASVKNRHVYRGSARIGSDALHPKHDDPNNNADSPTKLSRTGSSSWGGTPPGSRDHN